MACDYIHYLASRERICPCCGKEFMTHAAGDWGYMYGGMTLCSYTCMRKMERENADRTIPESDFYEGLKTAVEATKEDLDKIVDLRNKGLRIADIADRTGFSQYAVAKLLRNKKISKRQKLKVPQKQIEVFIKLYKRNVSYAEISRQCNVSATTVRRYILNELGHTRKK